MGLPLKFNACVLAVLAFAAIVQPGSALSCYSCSTTTSGNSCADPFNATEHTRNMRTDNCGGSNSQNAYSYNQKQVCKKIIQKVNGQREVKRMCAIPNHDEVDITNGPCSPNNALESHVTIESCYICNTDFCNGASSISGMQLLQACGVALITTLLTPSLRSFF